MISSQRRFSPGGLLALAQLVGDLDLGSALFGGTAPLVQTLLLQRTGNPLRPAGYVTAVALAAVWAVLLLRETAFEPLDATSVDGRRGFTLIG